MKKKSEKLIYRFRRVANRKNSTKRPMELYSPQDYEKQLKDLSLDKRQLLYLEQEKEESIFVFIPFLFFKKQKKKKKIDLIELDGFDTNEKVLLSIRVWNKELRRPTTIRDVVFLKSKTIGNLKEFLSNLTKLNPKEMVLFEEETEQLINPLKDDSLTLAKCQ